MQYKILIADDEGYVRIAIKDLLVKHGYDVEMAGSGDEAIEKIKSAPFLYGLVLLDYRMPGKDGATTAKEILAITQDLFVLIHSGDDSRTAIDAAWNAGVAKFIQKDANPQKFLETIAHWCKKYEESVLRASRTLEGNPGVISRVGFIGASKATEKIAATIESLRHESIATVLITGESGTGKEVLAKALHRNSPRREGPFVAVNCGAMPENLVESTLFGHEKGSFTGATNRQKGKFEEARGGTIFLDEIGEAALSTQVKLLRALQERVICPVGGKDMPIDVRVIAATNVDLGEAIKNGKFREDLFYRINVISMTLLPLRERPEDIEPLAIHLCEKYSRMRNRNQTLLKSTVKALEQYSWPGNVRELDNVIMRLVIENAEADVITPEHLGPTFQGVKTMTAVKTQTLKNHLEQTTKDYVTVVLRSSSSTMEAARKCGMAESTFRDLLKKMGIKTRGSGSGNQFSPMGQ